MTLPGRNTAVVPTNPRKRTGWSLSNTILPPGERESHGLFRGSVGHNPREGSDHAARKFRLAHAA